jgi:hypothetical protein
MKYPQSVFPNIFKVDHFIIVGCGKNHSVESQFAESGCPRLITVLIMHYLVKIGNVNRYAMGFQIGKMDLSKFVKTKLRKIIILPRLKQFIKKQLFFLFDQ